MKNDAKRLEIIANRKRFVQALRTTQKTQVKGRFRLHHGHYCALGLQYYEVMGKEKGDITLRAAVASDLGAVATNLGLTHSELSTIMRWNDTGSSFAEIADKFEKADFPITELPKRPISKSPKPMSAAEIEQQSLKLKKSLEAIRSLLALMQSDFGTIETPLAPMKSRAVPMERASSGPPKRRKEQLNRGREKEAGRITLEQWLERYGVDPQSLEQSA
jgi:hypothetical protein